MNPTRPIDAAQTGQDVPTGAATAPRPPEPPPAQSSPLGSSPTADTARPGGWHMGAWSLYFLAKLGLHAAGLLVLAVGLNLLLALVISMPLPRAWRGRVLPAGVVRGLGRLRGVATPLMAAALAYHESPWPPPARLVENWQAVSSFSRDYLVELALRVFNPWVVGALLLGTGVWWLLQRRLRLSTWVYAGLLAVPLHAWWVQAPAAAVADGSGFDPARPVTAATLDDFVSEFHATEAGKVIRLPREGVPPFDLLILSVCSLSWDDLDFARQTDHPFLRRLDVVFRQFNTAASYSGPAVLRLLHATCGQVPQGQLYGAAPPACYLLPSLRQAGYEPALLLNHDGHFDGFGEHLRNASGETAQVGKQAPLAMRSFDGSPIYEDFGVLGSWWRSHAVGDQRVALLYNTISLHDGNQVPGLASSLSSDTYEPRLRKLLGDLERLMAQIAASGRPTVVVLVPEHGGAVRGEAGQIAGLRDYPTPVVTRVPAGIALLGFGPPHPAGQAPVVVEQPASYFSLFALVASMLHGGEAAADRARLAAVSQALPPQAWVSENAGVQVVRQGGKTWLRESGRGWREVAGR